MPNIDFVTDQNPAVYLFMQDKNMIPDYVLNSNKITEEETSRLNKVAFADPRNKLYPCHTKEACWQSAAYFASKHLTDEAVKENIEKMASHHGIEEDVKQVFNAFNAEFEKVASSEESIEKKAYALELDMGGFQGRGIEKFYPINDRFEIVKAAFDSTKDYKQGTIPMHAMRKIAFNIMEAAHDNNVSYSDLTPEVKSLGTRNLPDPYAAEALVNSRKSCGVDAEPYKAIARDLQTKMASASPEDSIEMADEAAKEMYLMDKEANITYGRNVMTPYEMLFTGPTIEDLNKAASSTVCIKGVNVPVEDFLNLSDNTIEKVFSKTSGDVIKQAKAMISGEATVQSCVAAADAIADLDDGVRRVLLGTLANTAW